MTARTTDTITQAAGWDQHVARWLNDDAALDGRAAAAAAAGRASPSRPYRR